MRARVVIDQPCLTCDGTGWTQRTIFGNPDNVAVIQCQTCHGTGLVQCVLAALPERAELRRLVENAFVNGIYYTEFLNDWRSPMERGSDRVLALLGLTEDTT